MTADAHERSGLRRFALLSIVVAVLTISLKAAAFALTGSVGLLSDAVESLVNLAGAVFAFAMITVASRPADGDHAFGHTKAEYFSSGFEGMLVLLAAAGIVFTAARRLLSPRPLEDIGLGLAVSVLASLLNLGAALVIGRAGRRKRSISLQANSQHLMTDVWTSAGVLAGVAATTLTGWLPLDPLVAILVGCNIAWTAARMLRRSVSGLMDSSLPESELASIREVLDRYGSAEVRFCDMRTRVSGYRRFLALTVLVPGNWPVAAGHDLLDRIEADLQSAVRDLSVVTHMEGIAVDRPGTEDRRPCSPGL